MNEPDTRAILNTEVFIIINIPKLNTHGKGGITTMERLSKEEDVFLAGINPVSINYITSHIMSFGYADWENINLKFKPTVGWKGHIEI